VLQTFGVAWFGGAVDLRWIEPQRQSGMNLGLRLMWSTWRRPLRTRTGARRLVPTKGLILPGERECVEPIAAPRRTSRGFKAPINRCTILSRTPIGCGEPCRDRFERLFLPAIEKSGGVKAWIGDDTGFAKWRSFRWRRPGVFRATRQVGPRQQYQ
jgi:hypothetical protein